MEIKEKNIRITEADFFSGIFAVLSLRGYKTLPLDEVALAEVFQEFKKYAEQKGAELSFRIRLHQFGGDCETIHNGISNAAQRGIISLDSPGNEIIRIKLTEEWANTILGDITGGKLFVEIADRIVDLLTS